jgi:tRNA-modifying protein YgfZ
MTFTYYPIPQPGLLTVQGADAIAFLQRLTTNDVQILQPGKCILNILTSPEARIIDVFAMWIDQEHILLSGLPGRGAQTASLLKSRVFFIDRVEVMHLSQQFCQYEIFGQHIVPILSLTSGDTMPATGESRAIDLRGHRLYLLKPAPPLGGGLRLVAPLELDDYLQEQMQLLGGQELSSPEYEIQRVETGTPGDTGELTADFTPLENGLKEAVSLRKGCYTGQEVLARQVNYDKVTRQLRGLRLQQPASSGIRLVVDGKTVGTITSAVVSPRLGAIALAMIRRPHDQPGTNLEAVIHENLVIRGEVVTLPFPR